MCTFVWLFGENWSTISIRQAIEISMEAFKTAMDVYISYKFGRLLAHNSAVNAAQLCTAGINQQSG